MRNENPYYLAAKFYGVISVVLFGICVALFILWGRGCKPETNEAYWSKKFDSLYVVCREQQKFIDNFHEKSKGYYFINPSEKKIVKKFDLIKFTEQ